MTGGMFVKVKKNGRWITVYGDWKKLFSVKTDYLSVMLVRSGEKIFVGNVETGFSRYVRAVSLRRDKYAYVLTLYDLF